MSRDISPFGVRMPPALKDRVDAAAKEAGRSINAEIVARLEGSFLHVSADNLPTADQARAMAEQAKTDLLGSSIQKLLDEKIKERIIEAARNGHKNCLVEIGSELMYRTDPDIDRDKLIAELCAAISSAGYTVVAKGTTLDIGF